MHTTPFEIRPSDDQSTQIDFSSWVRATSDPSELKLNIEGFSYADLHEPARLAELTSRFEAFFKEADPKAHAAFDAYRASGGAGMTPQAISDVLLAASPHVSRFVATLFGVEREVETLMEQTAERGPLWRFKKEFAKKRLFKGGAGKAWTGSPVEAAHAARRALKAMGAPKAVLETGTEEEELAIAKAGLLLWELDDVARKAAKAGGVTWTDELHARAAKVRAALAEDPLLHTVAAGAVEVVGDAPSDTDDAAV
ncbi:MAG: pyridine nucleotide-disulfide oxidoreductase, partial [Polyangiaceae bacterium]|nr:pyridine nucleotide-disulfide oxidoreductase [Polyangiaceae bacterium]